MNRIVVQYFGVRARVRISILLPPSKQKIGEVESHRQVIS